MYVARAGFGEVDVSKLNYSTFRQTFSDQAKGRVAEQAAPPKQVLLRAAPPESPPAGPLLDPEGECLARAFVQQQEQVTGIPASNESLASARSFVAVDKAAFKQMMTAADMSTEGCKPWYLRKTTLAVGGVALAALAFVGLTR